MFLKSLKPFRWNTPEIDIWIFVCFQQLEVIFCKEIFHNSCDWINTSNSEAAVKSTIIQNWSYAINYYRLIAPKWLISIVTDGLSPRSRLTGVPNWNRHKLNGINQHGTESSMRLPCQGKYALKALINQSWVWLRTMKKWLKLGGNGIWAKV